MKNRDHAKQASVGGGRRRALQRTMNRSKGIPIGSNLFLQVSAAVVVVVVHNLHNTKVILSLCLVDEL